MSRVAAITDDEILAVLQSLSSLSLPEVRDALAACRVVRRRNRLSSALTTGLAFGFLALQFAYAFLILGASATLFGRVLPPGFDFFAAMAVFGTTIFLIASNPHLDRIGKALEADREAFRRRLELLDDTIASIENHYAYRHGRVEYG